ncbi:hypothetical protein [Streptomyces sp. MZ04]|uniref:hypothetical protein n=1 Tax=Streptomyces sp. MZ04 TaxID=2559236 RepID=UPI001432A966|nr:hypothetical protein [Streptomyces sp. MZ04]
MTDQTSSKWVWKLSAEEQDGTKPSGKSGGFTEGFTFSDWLEGAVILVIIGAALYKFLG